MNVMNRLAKTLFYIGLAICLLQVWLPSYLLTGDGPCHVYNAKVLHDFWLHRDTGFYKHFFSLVYSPNPNWSSHLLLAMLLFAVKAAVAEKILATIYVVIYTTGFYSLLKRLSGNAFVPLLVFLFVFNHIFFKGFYNFSMSVGIFFWVVELWLRYLEKHNLKQLAVLFAVALLLFFTHPMTFIYGGFTCVALCLSGRLSQLPAGKWSDIVRAILKDTAALLACFLPGMLLLLKFIYAEGGVKGIHLLSDQCRVEDLIYNNYIVCYTQLEEPLARVLAWIFIILFATALVLRISRLKRPLPYDGLLAACILSVFIYLYFPDTLLGGGIFIIRAHYMLFLLVACCIASLVSIRWLQVTTGIAAFVFFILLSYCRFPCAVAAGQAAADIAAAGDSIRPRSVLLPLDFSLNGRDGHGRVIADRNWLFPHAAQYIGANSPIILMDNYEADIGYFPLVWRPEVNPYTFLGNGGTFENSPPTADITGYSRMTGVTIDYVLMWCYDSSALKNTDFRQLYTQVSEGYNKVYTGAGGRVILYARKQ